LLQIYFIRHGQSENNVVMDEVERDEYLFHRVTDPQLTNKGKRQAELAASFLVHGEGIDGYDPQNRAGFGLTHLYCSLMTRAVETALPISRQTGLPLIAWPDVHENGGVFRAEKQDESFVWIGLPGKGRSHFVNNYPELVIPEDLAEEGWWNREKEPHSHYSVRARSIVDQLLERHGGTDDRVAIVMHGGIFTRIIGTIFNIQVDHYWFNMNNCGISRVDIRDDGRVMMAYMNKTDFLPDELIT
jgi:2,3-bisphosphoglycerate-dependent phosphoglycerate mutase